MPISVVAKKIGIFWDSRRAYHASRHGSAKQDEKFPKRL